MRTYREHRAMPGPQRIPLVDYLLSALKERRVDTVFGLPGGALGPLLDRLLADADIRLVVARHESGAVAMADGYARVTGRLGVALTTSGPGAHNSLPHLAVAQADNSPVLLLTGAVARSHHGRGGFQEGSESGIHTGALFHHCTKYSRELTHAGSAVTLIDSAVRQALAAPQGAAHLSIPVDLLGEVVDVPSSPAAATAWSYSSPQDGAREAADALVGATRPLLLLGNGARASLRDDARLAKDLVAFCSRYAVPVATTLKGKGLFPEDRAEALGVVSAGGSPRAQAYLTSEAPDVVLAVGSSLGEWATRGWTPLLAGSRALFQVDADPGCIGRSYRVDHGIQADAGDFLRALVVLEPGAAVQEGVHRRRHILKGLGSVLVPTTSDQLQAEPIKPQALMHHVHRWLEATSHKNVFVDVGNGTGWFTRHVAVWPPSQAFYPWGMASMGWANAAVIGAKLAEPESLCVTITGDGGFLMNAAEIATAAQVGAAPIWIVLDDNAFNMVRQAMHLAYRDSVRTTDEDFRLGSPDLAALARSLGARAYSVHRPDDLLPTLREAQGRSLTDRQPQLIRVAIDENEPGPFQERNQEVVRSFQAASSSQ